MKSKKGQSATLQGIQTIIVVQLFFSLIITIFTHSLPDGTGTQYTDAYSDIAHDIDQSEISQDLENSLTRQQNLPILDIGALVFYSGNLMLDLFLNFVFAIPEMLGLVIHGLSMLFNFDGEIVNTVEIFASVLTISLYLLGGLSMLLGVRSGSRVI